MKLTEIFPVGESYFHQYKLGDEFFNIECSQAEYEALGLPGAGAPSLPKGASWICSFAGTKFNTPSGRVENGQFFTTGNKKMVKLPNKPFALVDADKIVDGKLDPVEEISINSLT